MHYLLSKKSMRVIYKTVLICIWAYIVLFCVFNHDKLSVDKVLVYTPENPVLAAVLLLMLFALKSLSVVVYAGILYAASGIIFPFPVALIINILGTAVMVSLPYYIGMQDGAHLAEKIRKKFPKTELLKEFRDGNDFMFTLTVRLIGVLPCDIVSMYFGACKIKYTHYLAACIIGMLPAAVTFPLIGTNISNVGSPEFIISVSVNVALAVISFIVCKTVQSVHTKKTKKGETNSGENPQ